ncbi:hypothetical protein Dsin_031678 [Dipteronia sinensis]|uniref:Uncharacterized protein n=1 Tax=Dipteronia sinensis TaxID=43782 RepID=A0AAD9ZLU4_9ROSI|nr:hypothetical protein Dsin_031678 [Dipteronia sinensis]
MKSLQEAVRVQKNRNDKYKAYDLKGFAFAFQVWAYEAIPTLGLRWASGIGLGLACVVNWSSLEVCTILQMVTEEQQDSCQDFISTPGSVDEVPPISIQENEMFENTSPSMDEDAHQGDPADTAEKYNSATAAAFPFPFAVPSKEEWSTHAHRCEVEGQIEESPIAMAEFCHEEAVTSTVAVEVTTKRKSPDKAALAGFEPIISYWNTNWKYLSISQTPQWLHGPLLIFLEKILASMPISRLRDQLNSSLKKLSKVGHVSSSMINMVRTFCVNFFVKTDAYLKCKENVKRGNNSKEGMVLREELANNCSRFNTLAGDIRIVTDEIRIVADEIEELKKKLAEKEKYIFNMKVERMIW